MTDTRIIPTAQYIPVSRPRLSVEVRTRHPSEPDYTFTEDDGIDILGVVTEHSLDQPSGSFQLNMTARRDSKGRTWDMRISPMDYVEIRMGRGPGQLPIIMRGFVDKTERTFAVRSETGAPELTVTIRGRNYGKLLVKPQIFAIAGSGGGSMIFYGQNARQGIVQNLFYELGFTNVTPTPPEFLRKIVAALPKFISTDRAPQLNANVLDADFDPGFKVPLFSQTASLGSIWNLLAMFQASPWYELFVEDIEAGPQLTWRRAPYRGGPGYGFLPLFGKRPTLFPDSIELPAQYIQSMQTVRGDDNQFSYFMTLPEVLGPSNVNIKQYFGLPRPPHGNGPAVFDHDLARHFGFIPAETYFPLIFLRDEEEGDAKLQDLKRLSEGLATWLSDAYRDSDHLEEIQVSCLGNHHLRSGNEFVFAETGQRGYITSVMQAFSVANPSWSSDVHITRGRWPRELEPYPIVPTTPWVNQGPLPNVTPDDSRPGTTRPPTPTPAPLPGTPPPTPGGTNPDTGAGCPLPAGIGARITDPYGSPRNNSVGYHTGVDLSVGRVGAPITAPRGGVVVGIRACQEGSGGPGNNSCPGGVAPGNNYGVFPNGAPISAGGGDGFGSMIVIRHSDGSYSLLAHTAYNPSLRVGSEVRQGDVVGTASATGNWEGPHVHWEYWVNGKDVDPITACHGR